MYKVYKIVNVLNNKYYVGMTKQDLIKRFSQHKQNAKNGKDTYLYNAIRKYGIDNFEIELICECSSKEECCLLEIKFISENESGYNLAKGGEGGFVVQDIDTWKEKLKEARKGKTPAIGLKHSEETKQKCSEASNKYWENQETYKWEDIRDYSHKEAKEKFGISTTHYYRLKKQNGEASLSRSEAAKLGWNNLKNNNLGNNEPK